MLRTWSLLGTRSFALLLPLTLGLGGAPAEASGDGRKAPLRIRVPDAAGIAVRRALLAIKVRLAEPACRQVLSEFHSNGLHKPLLEVLELMGRTPEEHLDALIFQDGSRKGHCASPKVLAFTYPGHDTIYVCASRFKSAVSNNAFYAEMILIHEMLHTLGLGENPPTSLEITARVTELCG
jgi:hypothetical protein